MSINENSNNTRKKVIEKTEFNVTEFTTLGELLDMVKLGSKPETTPTPKQLRETAGEPIAWYPMSDSNDSHVNDAPDKGKTCVLYPNGYGVYRNETGQTVVWLEDCKSFTFEFDAEIGDNNSDETDEIPVPSEVLESMLWYTALTLVGDHRIEKNNLNRKGSRKGTRDYGCNDYGDKNGAAETAIINSYNSGILSLVIRPSENPLNVIIRAERYEMMMAGMTDKQKDAFLLYYIEGYTQQQIAKKLRIKQESVRDRLRGAKKKVKAFYKKYYKHYR